jgi:hypothetical protein
MEQSGENFTANLSDKFFMARVVPARGSAGTYRRMYSVLPRADDSEIAD